jgi:hypothetical protein
LLILEKIWKAKIRIKLIEDKREALPQWNMTANIREECSWENA